VLATLDTLGLREQTLVIVANDHGEEFLDHEGVLHGRTLYGELTRGVLVFRQPGRLPAGRVVTAPACHLDLLPTILECLGEKPDPAWWGTSQLPAIQGGGASSPRAGRPIFLEATTPRPYRGVVLERHKLILNVETGGEELYDLACDPGEKENVAAQQPEQCSRLRRLLAAHVAACAASAGKYQPADGPARLPLRPWDVETLRALGYLR